MILKFKRWICRRAGHRFHPAELWLLGLAARAGDTSVAITCRRCGEDFVLYEP